MKKYGIGYTQGVFDMFHIGHLKLLQNAKSQCDYLIVGVNTDRLVMEYKKKQPIIPEFNRMEIVRSIKYVDDAFLVDTLEKVEILRSHPFDVVFIGSDWKGSERWKNYEKQLSVVNIDIIYLPHTEGISSELLRKRIDDSIIL